MAGKYAFPRVGVGLFVVNPRGLFLMGKRMGSIGAGTYGLPGGHLELHETFERCAARELAEETGLIVPEKDIGFLTATNLPDLEGRMGGRHYVTIFMACHAPPGQEARVLEVDKCHGWEWVSWDSAKRDCDRMIQTRKETADPLARVAEGQGRNMFEAFVELFRQRPGFRLDEAMKKAK